MNAFLNSHGGVLYLGVAPNGSIIGSRISRKDEDEYRLAVDHTIGSFQPFIAASLYRLSFLPMEYDKRDGVTSDHKVIILKVSVGDIGEIYENGCSKVFIIDEGNLIGPLYPQELKELILLKYKVNIEGAEEAKKYTTPNLAAVRASARKKEVPKKLVTISEEEEFPAKVKPHQKSSNHNVKKDTTIKPLSIQFIRVVPNNNSTRPTVFYEDDFF